MSAPAYPSYKDSGVEWLGVIPTHWTVRSLKNVVEPLRPITYGIVQAGPEVADGVPYVRPTDMADEAGVTDLNSLMHTSIEIASAYQRSVVACGDLICSIGPSFGKAMVVPSTLSGANLTQGTARVAVAAPHSAKFVFWVLRSSPSVNQWECAIGGATFRALNLQPLANTKLSLPHPDEQVAIAAFLDRETAKIDELVEEQRRLIALLKEKRQAVISHAVTKGLDPNAPMRDSGVEWLGEVPAHWELTQVGRLCVALSYGFTNPMPTADDGPFMLTANDIGYGEIAYATARRTTSEAFNSLLTDKSRPHAGDVLLTKDGTLGRIAIHDGQPACINQSVAFLRADESIVSPRFLATALMEGVYQERMIYEAGGTTIKHIYISRLAKMPIALPPHDEMDRIVKACERHLHDFGALMREAVNAINLLQERRAALISAAVTGKIDVRGLVTMSEKQAAA